MNENCDAEQKKFFIITGPQQIQKQPCVKLVKKNCSYKEKFFKFVLIEWKKSKYGSIIKDKKIYVSHGGKCVLFQLVACDRIEVFNPEPFQAQHEEADTLIEYHTSKLMNHTILIQSSNTDVLVILLALQGCCSSNNTVILDYGAGNNRRYINISQLSEILEKCIQN